MIYGNARRYEAGPVISQKPRICGLGLDFCFYLDQPDRQRTPYLFLALPPCLPLYFSLATTPPTTPLSLFICARFSRCFCFPPCGPLWISFSPTTHAWSRGACTRVCSRLYKFPLAHNRPSVGELFFSLLIALSNRADSTVHDTRCRGYHG